MALSITELEAARLARLMQLLGHPLRFRMMAALAADGPGSATRMTERLGGAVSVGDCDYHLKELLTGGVIAIHDERKVRGGRESIYRVVPRSNWPIAAPLGHFISCLLPALNLPAIGPFQIAVRLKLDRQAVADVAALNQETRTSAAGIEAESRTRLKAEGSGVGTPVVLDLGLLDAG